MADTPQIELLRTRLRTLDHIQSLVDDDRWKALVATIKPSLRNGFLALVNSKLSLEDVRYWQGFYQALVIFTQDRQQSEETKAKLRETLEQEIKNHEQNESVQEALAAGDLPDPIKRELLKATGLL